MALVTVWKVPLERGSAEPPQPPKAIEVRCEVRLFGRDTVKVDGQVVADSWGQRFRRRVPVPIGAGHTAGVEIDVRRVWPICTLSVDGNAVAPTARPRIPLWGWSFAFVCIASWFVPYSGPGSASFLATRAVIAALGAWLSLFLGADEERLKGLLAGVFFAAAAWGFALGVR